MDVTPLWMLVGGLLGFTLGYWRGRVLQRREHQLRLELQAEQAAQPGRGGKGLP